MNRKQTKNSGFSLVELLVAIVILMIVVAPLLRSFLITAQINADSRRVLEATTVAQNVMEELKAASMEDLLEQKVEVTDEEGNVSEENLVKNTGNGSYAITYSNITENQGTYHVGITMEAAAYTAASGEALNYNDASLADIYKMDSRFDAFYVQTNEDDERQAEELADDSSVYSKMQRYIILDITKEDDVTQASVTVKYTYQDKEVYAVENSCIYKNLDSKINLRNVYLFLEPMYTSENSSKPKEFIEINNKIDAPVTIYLVKQENSNSTDTNELKYGVKIDVNEGRTANYMKEGKYQVVTALRTNLTEGQMKLTYGGQVQKAIGTNTFTAKELVGLNGLEGAKVEDRLYRVEVSVYDEENNRLVSIDGTKEK